MKTYVITLSRVFPKGHSQAGKPTNFAHLLWNGLNIDYENLRLYKHKIHTIRANYPFWEKRIAEVQAGQAVLSVRRWKDKPYRSPQEEIARLTASDGVGIQKLTFRRVEQQCVTGEPRFDGFEPCYPASDLASHDGLTLTDWLSWFLKYDHTKPMAIIHFTKFRY